MAGEKEKASENDQETIIPAEGAKDDSSEDEMKKAPGGGGFDKWFEFH